MLDDLLILLLFTAGLLTLLLIATGLTTLLNHLVIWFKWRNFRD